MHTLLAVLFLPLIAAQSENFGYTQSGSDWSGTCLSGRSQSPINIREWPINPVELAYVAQSNSSYIPMTLQYPPRDLNYEVQEPGVTYRLVNVTGDFQATKIGATQPTTFTLTNIHFHAPSEHMLNGERYPLEMHLVHTGDDGSTAVIGVWYALGEIRSPLLDAVINDGSVNVNQELGDSIDDYYFYSGSLTTPPCTEGVTWFIPRLGYRAPLQATRDQLRFFSSQWAGNPDFANGNGNNRQNQPTNGRTVYHFVRDPDSFLSFLN